MFYYSSSLVNRTSTAPGLSDHCTVVVDTNLSANINKKKHRNVLQYKKADWENIENDIKQFEHDYFNSRPDTASVEENWSRFKECVMSTISKNILCKTISGRVNLPYITREIKRLINKKKRIYNKARKFNRPKDWNHFRKLRKYVHCMLNKAYWNYKNGLLDPEQDNNNKQFWRYVKSKKQDSFGVSTLKVDGKVGTDSESKANMLNSQFSSVFTKQNTTNMPSKGSSLHPTMPDINISPAGVSKLLSRLNPSKAAGPDKFPARFLKHTSSHINTVLSHIFQQSIDTGEVPTDWRLANIAPIFKKGDRSKPSNYRPVSLTSILGKALEHIVVSQAMDHLDKHKILIDSQHGFRSRRSCETQLLQTTDDIYKT